MKTYIFFRGDFFYPVELKDDLEAIENVKCNPGTTKVEDVSGNIIWKEDEV